MAVTSALACFWRGYGELGAFCDVKALHCPFMEELFWRSFLLRWLDARDFRAADLRRTSPRAFALTAALFASEHVLWFAGLIAGLLYNWVYMRTGNLWVPIASHAITNVALGIWVITTGNWTYGEQVRAAAPASGAKG